MLSGEEGRALGHAPAYLPMRLADDDALAIPGSPLPGLTGMCHLSSVRPRAWPGEATTGVLRTALRKGEGVMDVVTERKTTAGGQTRRTDGRASLTPAEEHLLLMGQVTLRARAVLAEAAGSTLLEAPRVATRNTHGTGCTLSSALAALRPQRETWLDTARDAKAWLTEALRHAAELEIGHGHGPVHHFHALWTE